ncbi:MAG: 1-deoxy-D-xylulose-5-phosphate reductoisomerase, partial [bacterium]|nr:1-deoxy-D-xylulose-5-phosphate reductoisomerase [bacterium]
MKRKLAILGSTGSIGTQALDVVARHPDRFEVVALAAGRNVALLREQAERFHVPIATSAADGPEGLYRVAVESGAEIVLAATDGAVAFDAVFAAVERGIDIAVANKELIVAAGELFMAAAARSGSRILPVDSEHSAIFQCLVGEDPASIAGVILTASGGPFWRRSAADMANVTLSEALAHPTWSMGTKNTIDSATMMNKGLEIIEASRLFNLPGERLHITVHPQSIAHGFVVFTDGSVKGQLCAPDMRVPIGYALSYPNRLASVGDPERLTGAPPAAARPPAAEPPGPYPNRLASVGDPESLTGAPPAAARPPAA